MVPANQTEESEVRALSRKESGAGSGTPISHVNVTQTPFKSYAEPLQKEVPELIPDSFPESSRTSLSSVWFAGTTPSHNLL